MLVQSPSHLLKRALVEMVASEVTLEGVGLQMSKAAEQAPGPSVSLKHKKVVWRFSNLSA